jgi:hypothetical protein
MKYSLTFRKGFYFTEIQVPIFIDAGRSPHRLLDTTQSNPLPALLYVTNTQLRELTEKYGIQQIYSVVFCDELL